MILVSGPARIINGPNFYKGEAMSADMEVEFGKGKTLQLFAPNLLMQEALHPLQIGQSVHFEGYLDEGEPGYYVVKLTAIRRINNR